MNNNLEAKIDSTKNPRLLIIFMAGLPGIGKSTLFDNVIEHWINNGFNVVKVESDVLRQEAIKLERLKSESVNLTPLELEIKSKSVHVAMLNDKCREEIQSLREEEEGDSIFILDKNFINDALIEVIKLAANDFFGDNHKTFFILPRQSNAEDLVVNTEGKASPFYLDTLCASLIKCFLRKGHISLNHGFSHSLKSVMGVVTAYSGQTFENMGEKFDMSILYFDYFNTEILMQEPLRTVLKEKMLIIHDMVKNHDFDGDKCAELLLSEEELAVAINGYENHKARYIALAKEIEK